MSLCALCGHPTRDPGSVCGYHSADHGGDWARGNRLMCDLLHRGITLSTRREDDRLEQPETYGGWMRGRSALAEHQESEASGYVDLPGYR
jgi:hypothetical protein